MAIFFLSLLPQFVAPGHGATARILVLAALFVGMGIVWVCGYTLALSLVRGVLARPKIRRWLDRFSGALLVALGLRLAVERR